MIVAVTINLWLGKGLSPQESKSGIQHAQFSVAQVSAPVFWPAASPGKQSIFTVPARRCPIGWQTDNPACHRRSGMRTSSSMDSVEPVGNWGPALKRTEPSVRHRNPPQQESAGSGLR